MTTSSNTSSNTRRRILHWATAALSLVLFTVLGMESAFAAIPIGQSRTGKATYYNDAGYGACGTPINASTDMLVAVSYQWWTAPNPNNDELCQGISVEVSYNGRTITVPVKDKCMGCTSEHIDLSLPAIRSLGTGDVLNGITWKFVRSGGGGGACATARNWAAGTPYTAGTVVRYTDGRYYIAEHDNPGYDPIISTWYWDPYAC
ncbi:Rare lipoprotein A (RlpA)-like double-psi beta-barrel [Streptomyces sp. yr375]|nr:cysteine/serine endopeptidase inhibitor [Streptomyces sp. yr375]SEQ57412.1 Rare lipoprotein A (RlpA)-like double-psi beta-barrel [Streptomyces sp. yr375]